MSCYNLFPTEWTAEKRLDAIHKIMSFSPRDWSIIDPEHYTGKYKDKESWNIWCLACSDTREDALNAWNGFLNDE